MSGRGTAADGARFDEYGDTPGGRGLLRTMDFAFPLLVLALVGCLAGLGVLVADRVGFALGVATRVAGPS